MFYYYIIGALSFALLYTNREPIRKRINKIKSLYALVSTHHKQIFTILRVMMSIVAKTIYLSIVQYFNKTMIQMDKNTYELTYTIGGNMYKMIIRIKRGPRKLIYAFDQDSKDVTEIIQTYLGPNDDFHHGKFTPDFFGFESITVNLSDGEEKSFTRFQPISI
jgi:hypothetical protein